MTSRQDMRYWPFEEWSSKERTIKRIRNGMTDQGIRWAVMGQSGYTAGINGYAQIPWEGHPWTGCEDYDELDVQCHGGLTYGPKPEFDMAKMVREVNDATAGTDHPMNLPEREIEIRPATAFADCGGWIGFDTQHAWDVWTDEELARVGLERKRIKGLEWPIQSITDRHSVVWTLELIVAEAELLAHQIYIHALVERANRKDGAELE